MGKDVLKTVGAIVLILAIVAGTFWYGSQQRSQQTAQNDQQEQQMDREETSGEVADEQQAEGEAGQEPVEEEGSDVAATIGQPQPTTIPNTGSELLALIPAAIILGMYQVKRTVKKALYQELLSR